MRHRARILDSENFVDGYHVNICATDYIITDDACAMIRDLNYTRTKIDEYRCIESSAMIPIDVSTLAYHHDDMIDIDGKELYASYNKHGHGADEISFEYMHHTYVGYLYYEGLGRIVVRDNAFRNDYDFIKNIKFINIKG